MVRKVIRKVKKVIDGDTVIVSSPVSGSKYIRIAGVNAPEKRQMGYQTAKANLKSRIGGKKVWVTPVGKSYGRIVARIRKIRKDKRGLLK
ncbi:MAG: thermonuclease family protein [Nanoarchaeota archaeon]|nr:hypothetical protein [Candidatus Woesearchaeota archaeon]MBU4069804.1 thermonuclease family protein [Nanoarchaeota archaeon]